MIYTTQPCPVCGLTSNFQLLQADVLRWKRGALAQNVFPDMTNSQREVLISGTHPECWDSLMGDEDE